MRMHLSESKPNCLDVADPMIVDVVVDIKGHGINEEVTIMMV